MSNFKTVISILVLVTLIGVVHPAAFAVAWTFSGDTITVTLDGNANNKCIGTFTGGHMRGVASTGSAGGGHACGAKMMSATTFSLIVVDLTATGTGGIASGSFLGATGPETYGQSGSSSNFETPSATGLAFAEAFYAGNGNVGIPAVFQALPTAESGVGNTMIVRIYNQVQKDWSSSLTLTGMTTWTLSGDLNQGQTRDLTIQFGGGASATATATFTSGAFTFEITASLAMSAYDVKIKWGTITNENDHYVVPPSFSTSAAQSIGWRPGGTYNVGIFKPAAVTNANHGTKTSADWKKTWMKDYASFFNDKKMYQIIIPGTHDAAANRFALPLVDFYYQCQTLATTILEQLNKGVRSFDLRIIEIGGTFLMMHAQQTVIKTLPSTPLTLLDVLNDVNTFVTTAGNDKEIIILDFHRFLQGSNSFNHANCKAVVTGHALNTNSRLILPTKSSMTYSQLISDSATARVIAAYNDASSSTPFWPGVTQKWAGATVYKTSDMFTYFTNQFTATQTALTSAQDALSRPDGGPFFWYYLSENYFSDKARAPNLNIIHSDWIETSYKVETAIAMNLVKVNAVSTNSGGGGGSGAASLIVSLVTTLALSLVLFV